MSIEMQILQLPNFKSIFSLQRSIFQEHSSTKKMGRMILSILSSSCCVFHERWREKKGESACCCGLARNFSPSGTSIHAMSASGTQPSRRRKVADEDEDYEPPKSPSAAKRTKTTKGKSSPFVSHAVPYNWRRHDPTIARLGEAGEGTVRHFFLQQVALSTHIITWLHVRAPLFSPQRHPLALYLPQSDFQCPLTPRLSTYTPCYVSVGACRRPDPPSWTSISSSCRIWETNCYMSHSSHGLCG